MMTKSTFLTKLIFCTLTTAWQKSFAMYSEIELHGPCSFRQIRLDTPKQSLTVKTPILLSCSILTPLIENGKTSIPLPGIPEYDLLNIACCLQAHYNYTHAPNQEDKDRADNQLEKQTNTREKLQVALMGANYLDNEQLLNWCMNKWARKSYITEDTCSMPHELEADIGYKIIKKTTLPDDIPRWFAKAKWLNPTKLIKNPRGSIWAIGANSTGTQIASSDYLGFISIYTPENNTEPLVFKAHNLPISTVSFTQNDKKVITCARDGTIKFWDICSQPPSVSLQIQTEKPNAPFVFKKHEPSKQFAYNEEGNILVCNLASNHTKILTGHTHSIKDLAFNINGNLLASGGCDTTIKLWNLLSKECIANLTPHTESTLCLAFSPDDSLLAAGSADKNISIHEVATRKLTHLLMGHKGAIWSVIFSPDAQFLYSGSIDGTLKIWHLPTGSCIKNLANTHSSIQSMSLLPSGALVTASRDGSLNFWDINQLLIPIWALQKRLRRDYMINQACLIEDAYKAPQHKPLDCSNKRERIKEFESLDDEMKNILIKELHVKSPKKKTKVNLKARKTNNSSKKVTPNKKQRHTNLHYNRK